MVRVELRGLERMFSDGTRVGPIDLLVEDGELVTLLGPSGVGKTTTLRMIAGFIRPDSGDLLFDGTSVVNVPPRERGIGMVFQTTALFPNMDVFQNISFSLDMAGVAHEQVVRRVEELADLLRIRPLLHKKVSEISGGEAQRVALARALARNPQLLLLDEPLSALDPQLRERLQAEIRRIQSELRITTIYVTHSQEEAFAISDRIAVMRDGVIVQAGAPEDLYDHPADDFVARFLGGGNVFSGVVVNVERDVIHVDVDGHRFLVAGTADVGSWVTFVVKPEDVKVSYPPSGAGAEAEVQGIIPQVGTYRAVMRFNGSSVISLIVDPDLARTLRSKTSPRVSFTFAPEAAVLLPATLESSRNV
ncbi:MAG: ABC transporter ATP-binding protein [Candidatus Thorarchaeota archaeon]